MAIYRIKKDDTAKDINGPDPAESSQEYWQEIDPELSRDLDFEEFEELNKLPDDEEEYQPIVPMRKRWLQAALALVVIVAFTLWISLYMVNGSIDWGILSRSSQLAQDESLSALREAVVVIEGSGGSGSGFNISADGLIVTNRHVVENSGIITIRFGGDIDTVFTTKDWVEVSDVDMALIKIDGNDLPYLQLNSNYPHTGDAVIFIGNPLGYDWTISEGEVISMVSLDGIPLIYLQGPVLPGSSGSPLFNADSEVIGVIFASLVDEDNQGLAIPISYLNTFLEESYEY